MAGNRRVVIGEKQAGSRIGEWANEGAVISQWMVERGVWKQLEERLRVSRSGGFVGVDVVLYLVMYFASRLRCSLKDFGQRARGVGRQVAALAHRRELPTASSVSRFLSAVQVGHTRALASWLLIEACDAASVLKHAAASQRDSQGRPWHVFDWDGSNTVLRHRALPHGEELPAGQRRTTDLATPGYTGRKRGEVRLSRATLQHAGTGLWIDMVASSERADCSHMLPSALSAMGEVERVVGIPRDQMLLRIDGAGGNVPIMTACQKAGVPYLVRSAHYILLQDPAVRERLQQGPWYWVPSSLSGPARQVAELGWVKLSASSASVDDEGKPFAPIETRMVVSRFAATEKSGAGVMVDSYQYELFATAVAESNWPAPELVQLYFSRSAEENRFAQEDREIGLDRILSYHLAGQELACLIGLFVWNVRIVMGAAMASLPTQLPEQLPREVLLVPTDRQAPAPVDAAPPQTTPTPAAPSEPGAEQPSVSVAALPADSPQGDEGQTPIAEPPPSLHLREVADEIVPWSSLLARLGTGWSRAPQGAALTCPMNATLPLMAVTQASSGRLPRARFAAAVSDCRPCAQRADCTSSGRPWFAKVIAPAISEQHAATLARALLDRPDHPSGEPPKPSPRDAAKPSPAKRTAPYPGLHVLLPRPTSPAPGPYAVSPWRLLPAELRHLFETACRDILLLIDVSPPPPAPRRPIGLALTAAEVQRRRTSWLRRANRNALPDDHSVTIELHRVDPGLRALLLAPSAPPAITGKAAA